ncbi:MAG TPA: long-chain fatty acid--CoA ligase [Bryobacteraceae bacterium]|jgi:fatty-acyl-CoA synthase|nr:long-chain fatty acid--CoA ligase [Bryobacteraceae bacterium]
MTGLMMDYPLTLTHILERAAKIYPRREIASRVHDGSMHRYTYRDFHRRVHLLAHALDRLGVQPGDRIGTLCWNSYRHLELYFAVPCAGAVLHTLNLRLSPDQLAYIVNHAEDRVIFVDASLLPVLESIRGELKTVRQVVVLNDVEYSVAGDLDYESLLAESPDTPYSWPSLNEDRAAAMCYTSGTTGNPKGVVYSHRALFLHSYGLCMADTFALSERDTILQLVPMFHANGWGLPYAGIMTGSRLVFCGRHLQSADIALLIEQERATFSCGVPTLWMGLYSYLESHPHDISSLRLVVVAGAALPRQFVEGYEKRHRVHFMLCWGMTEITPIGTVTALKTHLESLPEKERFDLMARHGIPLAGLDLRVVFDDGKEVPWDGIAVGEIQVRGPWVAGSYYNDARSPESFVDGWLRTGDIATVDAEGYIQIADRTKDLVKSGGEWISSVDLENALMAHPKVAEAAVVSVFHPRWQERPLACVVPRDEYKDQITKQELLDFLAPRVAKWWLPDDVVFIEAVPRTSVGKFNKRALREQFRDYKLPTA